MAAGSMPHLPREGEDQPPVGVSWSWILQRFTGVLLLVFLGGHLWVEHFMHVGQLVRFRLVLIRLSHWLYDGVDLGLLVTVVYHGLNGLRAIIREAAPVGMAWLEPALWGLGILTVVWGADILWAFWYHRPFLIL